MLERLLKNLEAALITDDRWKTIVSGLGVTLQIAVVATLIGIVLGVLVAVVKIYAKGSKNPVLRVLNAIAELYTTVIRGTPLVIQLMILFSLALTRNFTMLCAVGFGINSGAYVSEIFRGGINSVDVGQMEAGRSLGLSRNQTMVRIILPQAAKNALPALFNEFIILVKETSVAGYIGVQDLTKAVDLIKGRTANATALFIAAAIYLVLTIILTQILRFIERRLARSDRG